MAPLYSATVHLAAQRLAKHARHLASCARPRRFGLSNPAAGLQSAAMHFVAHRGASHDAPENTLAAARLAWEQGADAVECDVQLTRDGRLAVIHDEDTWRTTGRAGRVADFTLEELQLLDAGAWKQAQFAGERIPSLEQWLATVPAPGQAWIELKGGPETGAAFRRAWERSGLPLSQVVVISFELGALTTARQLIPGVAALWVLNREETSSERALGEVIRRAGAAGVGGLDLEDAGPIDPAPLRAIHAAGLRTGLWTVDDPHRAKAWAAAGIDAITTNRPGWLRSELSTGEG